MPFMMNGPNDENILFFCKYDETWKTHYVVDDGPIMKLNINAPDVSCECSPSAWHDGSWNVSFIGLDQEPRYYIYHAYGPTLDSLSTPQKIIGARMGFVYQNRLVYAEHENNVYVQGPNDDLLIQLKETIIYRVTYRHDVPDKLLITGQRPDKTFFTSEYDLGTNEEYTIECGGKSPYKCTILGDAIIHAERVGGFEQRKLKMEHTHQRKRTKSMKRHNLSRLNRLNGNLLNDWKH